MVVGDSHGGYAGHVGDTFGCGDGDGVGVGVGAVCEFGYDVDHGV